MWNKERIKNYGRLMRLDRPVGTLLLAWSTLWGLWLAGAGSPPAPIVLILLLGTFFMRALGCVLNDYADRHFDGHVQRTQHRPLAQGLIRPGEALGLALLLALVNALLVWQLNAVSRFFALFCLLLAVVYPFCKRFFMLPQLVLGLAFAAPIPMAQLAIHGHLSAASLLLYLASVLWALIYDGFYALVDRADDLKLGLRSSAIFMQGWEKRFLTLMAALMLLLLLAVGCLAHLNGWYFGSLAVAALLFAYEIYRIRGLERERCFQAFLHNNWVGVVIWGGLVLSHLPPA